jgi:hypothetical protein
VGRVLTHTPSLRDRAEVIALGVELGVLPRAHAMAWAEEEIAATPHPDASLLEVITMDDAYENDVANALRAVPGELDAGWVEAEVVRMLLRRLTEDPERGPAIAAALYRIAVDEALSDRALSDFAYWLDDAFSLADAGITTDTRAELFDALRGALERAVER